MTPAQKPARLGMNTDELKAFTELNTTLRLSIEGLNSAISNMSSDIKSLRKETNDRFDRIESRWDERLRIVEALTIEHKVIVDANKEDVVELKKRSDNRDWIAYAISGVAALLGMLINPRP